jgi:hypothetical protein
LREHLLAQGYRQTTLTNFERCDLQNDPRRYMYELMSFQPDRFDVLGFGPSGISCSEQTPGSSALKTMNPESAVEYLQAVQRGGTVWNRYYEFREACFTPIPLPPCWLIGNWDEDARQNGYSKSPRMTIAVATCNAIVRSRFRNRCRRCAFRTVAWHPQSLRHIRGRIYEAA